MKNLSRAIESIWINQLKILELKIIMQNMKNLMNVNLHNSKLETAEEKVSKSKEVHRNYKSEV